MSDRIIIWEGKYYYGQSRLVLEGGSIHEEALYNGYTRTYPLSNFLEHWGKGRYSGPPLPEEVKVELALREIKR